MLCKTNYALRQVPAEPQRWEKKVRNIALPLALKWKPWRFYPTKCKSGDEKPQDSSLRKHQT